MPSAPLNPDRAAELLDPAIATVRQWLDDSQELPRRRARMPQPEWGVADLVRDPESLEFASQFIELVMRAPEERVAARNLERLSREMPPGLPRGLRVLVQLAGGFSILTPKALVPLVQGRFRHAMRGLVIEDGSGLGERLGELQERGIRVDLAPFGDAVLGRTEADRRLNALTLLLQRGDVDRVSVRLADLVGPMHPWAHDDAVERAIDRLEPVFMQARGATRITLEMGGREQLDATIDVFTGLLSREDLAGYEGAVTLPANLPDSIERLAKLADWAVQRTSNGGAAIRVRLVKGVRHPGALATRAAIDANYKRMLDLAFAASPGLTVTAASNNLFDLAFARHLAEAHNVESLEAEMHLGATPYADAVHASGLPVTLYAPLVTDDTYGAVGGYLVERLREQVDGGYFRSAVPALAADEKLFRREAARFEASVAAMDEAAPTVTVQHPSERADPATREGREWGRRVLAQARMRVAEDLPLVRDLDSLDSVIEASVAAGEEWAARTPADRVNVVLHFASALEAHRDSLVATLVRETGLTIAEAETEALRALAVVRRLAREATIDVVDHAEFEPAASVLVAPGWVAAASDTAEGIAAAVLAGSPVIVQPAHQARQVAASVVRAAQEAGMPVGTVTLVIPEDAAVARRAVTHPDVERVVFTGDADTARLLRSWRPERPPLGDVRGVASVIVTESADLDTAARAIVSGGLMQAGQHPHGARLVILVGAMGESQGLRQRLSDAVRSLHPAPAVEASSRMGPLVGTPVERMRRLLSLADNGEHWLVEPESLDDGLTLWRAGIRDAVDPEDARKRAIDGPALVLTAVPDLDAAIQLQNALHGEAAGIHTLDIDELAAWLDRADSGSLHVNRATVGHLLDSLQGGGWRGAGGPRGSFERVMALGAWAPVFGEPEQSVRLDGISDDVRTLIEAAQPAMKFLEFDLVRAGARSDEQAWMARYRDAREEEAPSGHRTVVRHLPVETTVRLAQGASPAQLVRALAAATRAGARVHISSADALPEPVTQFLANPLLPLRLAGVRVEDDVSWFERARDVATPHIRLLGGDGAALATVLSERPDVALFDAPLTTSGRLELLPFLRAQVVTLRSERGGRPDPMVAQLEF